MNASGPSVVIIGTRGYPSYYGGFETAVRRLAPFLVKQGWDVTVYGRSNWVEADDPARDTRVDSVRTRGMDTRSLSTFTYGLTATWAAVRRRPDVALVMNVANGYWLPLLKARGIPTVVNVDGIEWQREKWGRAARLAFRGGARMTAWFANELVVDANAIGTYWHDHYGRAATFIPYGGDPGTRDSSAPMGLPSRGYALVVSRLVPENTLVEFIDAAVVIAERYPVIIVGSAGYGGELDDAAQTLAESHKNVRWLGHVADDSLLGALWAHAGAYFHGHSVGGTNPALVQAMALGAPIVARDTVYNREVLEDAGVFVPADADAIAQGLLRVLGDPALQDRLSAAAATRAREHYSWDAVCHQYEALLARFAMKNS